jgi:hypothetical protein
MAASGMEVRGMAAKLKNMEAVAKPLTKLPRVRGDLGCSADMRMTLVGAEGGREGREGGLGRCISFVGCRNFALAKTQTRDRGRQKGKKKAMQIRFVVDQGRGGREGGKEGGRALTCARWRAWGS